MDLRKELSLTKVQRDAELQREEPANILKRAGLDEERVAYLMSSSLNTLEQALLATEGEEALRPDHNTRIKAAKALSDIVVRVAGLQAKKQSESAGRGPASGPIQIVLGDQVLGGQSQSHPEPPQDTESAG